jgi:putative membrane protein
MRIPNIQRSFRNAALALASLAAVGVASAQTTTGAMSGDAAMPRNGAKVAGSDSAFMKQAAQNNSMEIVASKLALTKSTNADVKTFAQQMIDDHTKTGDEMKALASSKGVEVSDKPSVAQSAKIKLLETMSGPTFDKRYAAMIGVTAHQDTVKLFQKATTNVKDADVKAFASKTLPALQHHLQMAQELKASVDGGKS